MIRTVIVDDEPLARRRLRDLLMEETDVEVLAEFGGGEHARRELPDLRPDVVFVDVQMPGVSGFDVVHFLRETFECQPAAIFVTAFEEYAVRAFEEGALDYLLKPFERARFSKTMLRIREWRRLSASERSDPAFAAGPARVAVKTASGMRVIRFDEIDWIESAANYVRIHVGRERFLFRDTIHHFESTIGTGTFVRINRSMLVNVDRIALLQPSVNRDFLVVLRDGQRLTLTRAYRSRLQSLVTGLS